MFYTAHTWIQLLLIIGHVIWHKFCDLHECLFVHLSQVANKSYILGFVAGFEIRNIEHSVQSLFYVGFLKIIFCVAIIILHNIKRGMKILDSQGQHTMGSNGSEMWSYRQQMRDESEKKIK